jgi:hypothetical protein
MPMPSAHERRLSEMLEEGTMPDRPMLADVMTNTDRELTGPASRSPGRRRPSSSSCRALSREGPTQAGPCAYPSFPEPAFRADPD